MNNKLNELIALMREKGIPEDLIKKFENNPQISLLSTHSIGIIKKMISNGEEDNLRVIIGSLNSNSFSDSFLEE